MTAIGRKQSVSPPLFSTKRSLYAAFTDQTQPSKCCRRKD